VSRAVAAQASNVSISQRSNERLRNCLVSDPKRLSVGQPTM
jgi:hypothetical protein